MNGIYYKDWFDLDIGITIKKISPFGQLLINKYLPYRKNSGPGFLVNLNPNPNIPKFVVVNTMRKDTSLFQAGSEGWERSIRYTFLDSNLAVYKTIDKYDNVGKYIRGNRLLKNGNILLFGNSQPDSMANFNDFGWAREVDTNGVTIWNKTYIVNDSANHFLHDSKQDEFGNIYFAGSAWGYAGKSKQVGIIIKVDSNGCLDPAFCYPLNIKEIEKIPDGFMQLYPNPANSYVQLQLSTDAFIGGQACIYDATGKLMATIPKVQKSQKIDVQGYASGMYYLQYSVGDWRGGSQFRVE